MSRSSDLVQKLGAQLGDIGMELVDAIPLPRAVDRMVRLRTLEEALEEFDQDRDVRCLTYLVQIRPAGETNRAEAAKAQAVAAARVTDSEPIYLADGSVNLPFLQRSAELLFSSGEYGLARNIYKTILTSGDRSDIAHFGIACCDEAEGKAADAIRHYEESIAYQPTLEAYRRLASLLTRWKKDQQCAEVLQRALHLKGLGEAELFELHLACGNAWLKSENPPLAENHYRSALEIRPGSDAIFGNLGALYLQMGRTSDARQHFQKVVEINPGADQAHAGLGACALADGDRRGAHDHFAAAVDANLQNSSALYQLVRLAYELKIHATATRLLESYCESAPVNANLLYSLAGLQYHLSRTDDAATTCRRILAIQKEHGGAKDLLRRMQPDAVI